MKKIGFIGAYDQIDYIIYIAKIMVAIGKKVLVIDDTLNQKARYVVPVINPTISYVTEFEGIDIAVGFQTFEEIKRYVGVISNGELNYDYLLICTDHLDGINEFGLKEAEKNYFITSSDVFSLKKGTEIFNALNETIELTKIMFSREMSKEEDDYLNFISSGYKIQWDNDKIYFPIENGDLSVIYENQRVEKIKFKKLSTHCIDSLLYLTEQILGNVNISQLRKTIRLIDKSY